MGGVSDDNTADYCEFTVLHYSGIGYIKFYILDVRLVAGALVGGAVAVHKFLVITASYLRICLPMVQMNGALE